MDSIQRCSLSYLKISNLYKRGKDCSIHLIKISPRFVINVAPKMKPRRLLKWFRIIVAITMGCQYIQKAVVMGSISFKNHVWAITLYFCTEFMENSRTEVTGRAPRFRANFANSSFLLPLAPNRFVEGSHCRLRDLLFDHSKHPENLGHQLCYGIPNVYQSQQPDYARVVFFSESCMHSMASDFGSSRPVLFSDVCAFTS